MRSDFEERQAVYNSVDPLEKWVHAFFWLVSGTVLGLFSYRLLRAFGHMP